MPLVDLSDPQLDSIADAVRNVRLNQVRVELTLLTEEELEVLRTFRFALLHNGSSTEGKIRTIRRDGGYLARLTLETEPMAVCVGIGLNIKDARRQALETAWEHLNNPAENIVALATPLFPQ